MEREEKERERGVREGRESPLASPNLRQSHEKQKEMKNIGTLYIHSCTSGRSIVNWPSLMGRDSKHAYCVQRRLYKD